MTNATQRDTKTVLPAYRGAEDYVFICYSHRDTDRVHDDLALLSSRGVRIWYDEGISPGTEWSDELARALDHACLMIFYASKASTESRHCRDEIGFALNRDKRILTIHLEPVTLPAGLELSLGTTQAIKKTELDTDSYVRKMLDVLPAATVGSAAPVAAPAPRRRSHLRRFGLAYAGVVLVCAVLVGALNRDYLTSRWFLFAADHLSDPIEQQIGFATTADGVRIAYATTGAGPPVLIVLGWATHLQNGLNSPTYDPQGVLAMSSESHRIIRYDGRGFGLSDRGIDDFSVAARVSDIEAVVEALGLERFALYAMSAGGPAGIAYTARHPERVTSLTLAGTFANWNHMSQERRESFKAMQPVFATSWQRAEVVDLMIVTLFPNVDGVGKAMVREFLWRSTNGPDMAGFWNSHFDADVSEEAAGLEVPVMVMHAAEDETVSPEAGRYLASLIPNARFEIVPGGHQEGTGATPQTRSMILEFIDSEPSPADQSAD